MQIVNAQKQNILQNLQFTTIFNVTRTLREKRNSISEQNIEKKFDKKRVTTFLTKTIYTTVRSDEEMFR